MYLKILHSENKYTLVCMRRNWFPKKKYSTETLYKTLQKDCHLIDKSDTQIIYWLKKSATNCKKQMCVPLKKVEHYKRVCWEVPRGKENQKGPLVVGTIQLKGQYCHNQQGMELECYFKINSVTENNTPRDKVIV